MEFRERYPGDNVDRTPKSRWPRFAALRSTEKTIRSLARTTCFVEFLITNYFVCRGFGKWVVFQIGNERLRSDFEEFEKAWKKTIPKSFYLYRIKFNGIL